MVRCAHSARLPEPVGPGRRDCSSPTGGTGPLGRSCDSTTSKALSAAAWWLPLGQPFSTAGAAERLTAAAGRLAPCLARPPKYMRTAPARHPTHGCHCRSLVGVVTPIATVTEAVQRPSAQPVGWLITRSLWAAASTPTLSRYAVSALFVAGDELRKDGGNGDGPDIAECQRAPQDKARNLEIRQP